MKSLKSKLCLAQIKEIFANRILIRHNICMVFLKNMVLKLSKLQTIFIKRHAQVTIYNCKTTST